MDAVGTSASPVTFTSYNDSSAGGATGSGSPAAGDWLGITVDGTADIQDAVISYAVTPLTVRSADALTVKDDSFVSPHYQAVVVNATGPAPEVEGNSVTGSGEQLQSDPTSCAYEVTSQALDFGLLGGNTAGGGAAPCFGVSGTVVTSTVPAGPLAWVLSGTAGASFSGDEASLEVPATATLTVAPGAVIKAAATESSFGGLTVLGELDAVGTSASPVTFTSYNDSSAGGATGSGSPAAGTGSASPSTGPLISRTPRSATLPPQSTPLAT